MWLREPKESNPDAGGVVMSEVRVLDFHNPSLRG